MKRRGWIRAIAIVSLLFLQCSKSNLVGPFGDSNLQHDIPWTSLAGAPWPTYSHDFQHTGRSPYRGPQKGEIQWYFEASNWIQSSPAVGSDGSVYFSSTDRFLYSISSGGSLNWKFDLGGSSNADVTLSVDGMIYVSPSPAGRFYSFTLSGSPQVTYQVSGDGSFGAPLLSVDGQTIYFAARDSAPATYALFALGRDGILRWKFVPPQHDLSPHTPAISPNGNVIYCSGVGSPEAPLYAIDTSGALRWRYSVNTADATVSGTSSPCVDNNGNVFFGGGSSLYSLDANGKLRWRVVNITWLSPSSPVIGRDGAIYIAGTKLWAINGDGSTKWVSSLPYSNSTPAIDVDGTIYLGSSGAGAVTDTNSFYAFNSDGSLKFALVLRNSAGKRLDITSAPAIASDGTIYIGSDNPQGRRLFKIR